MCIPACKYVAYFSTFYDLLMNAVSLQQLIERTVEIYTQMYIHLCIHKIPQSFDHIDHCDKYSWAKFGLLCYITE